MTHGTLIDALPDRPADPDCKICRGKGFWRPWHKEYAQDCPCRFSPGHPRNLPTDLGDA
jgi:hypothetical protein